MRNLVAIAVVVALAATLLWVNSRPTPVATLPDLMQEPSMTEPAPIAPVARSGDVQAPASENVAGGITGSAIPVTIGEPLDPRDPSTWAHLGSSEPILIGEPLDPNDPSSWVGYGSQEKIVIGEVLDPNDRFALLKDAAQEPIHIGAPMDPFGTDDIVGSEQQINIGEPMSPGKIDEQ